MELLSKVHAKHFLEWVKDRPEVVVMSGDLTSSTEIDLFRDTYPGRFYSMGMTEQNMMSMAGGMAREGYTPFVHTFAVFMYRRALDQISMSIAYPNLPVRMVGFLPGILTPGGATHQAIEDIAIMRSLPNMTVLETGDATDVESVLDVAQAIRGPVYIRMLRGEIPRLFPIDEPMQFNHARRLSTGSDITLITSGICTEEAMRATAVLSERGLGIEHLHVTTLKPFSDKAVVEAVKKAEYGVITMENHTVLGGLGTAVAEVMAENGVAKRLLKLGIQDKYAHGASPRYLMREYGLDAISLIHAVERLTNQTLDIKEEELADVRLDAVHSDSKAEAL
ncbi:transketolase family protein [Alicyclobacillus sp. ALC3]|uniref:transketolase family protein n=1 Tax=Alicyclobacillus sp. ALC3 TaxID=2796143 RepID=UPI002378538C|nr:transketolase C-terminal domain-containing protein [Alicyclobacillus sp. ALC3]WDL98553.1 hypothetical protein JC200_07725 [Alicyclobacillus sp. ALC3]